MVPERNGPLLPHFPVLAVPGDPDIVGGGAPAGLYRFRGAETFLSGRKEPYTIREIGGRNIRELRHLRVTTPHKQVEISDGLLEQIDQQPSARFQVAVPKGLVLAGSDFSTFREQQLAVAEFAEKVRRLYPDIKAIMASARDVLELEDALREEGDSYFGKHNKAFAIRTRDGLIVRGRHHLQPEYAVSRDGNLQEYLHGVHIVALIVPADLPVAPFC